MANDFNTRVAAAVGAIEPLLPRPPAADVRTIAKWIADAATPINESLTALHRFAALMGGEEVESDATHLWTGAHDFESTVRVQTYIDFKEQASAPTHRADHARLYSKEKAGVTALYYKRDNGDEIELLPGGSSGTFVGGSGTPTQIAFWDTTSTITSDALLYWDTALNRLGVGTSFPDAGIHVIHATEQLRVAFDTANYLSVTVDNDGLVTLDAVGDSTQHAIRTADDPFGINRTPADAWFEIQNVEGGDGSDEVFALTPWAWWSADYITSTGSPYNDGDDLGVGGITWYDRSLNARHLTFASNASAPDVQYQVTGEFPGTGTPGKPAIEFISTGRGQLPFPDPVTGGIPSLDSYTAFVVFKQTTALNGFFLFRDNNGTATPDDFLRPPAASGGLGGTNDNWRQRTSESSVSRYFPGVDVTYTDTSYNVHVGTYDATTGIHTMRLNGVAVGSSNSGVINDTLQFTRFRESDGSFSSGVDNVFVAEVIVFASVLGSTPINTVETYLNNKYALNGGTPITTAGFDYSRYYDVDDNLLHWVDTNARVAASDIDMDGETLAARLTLVDATGRVMRLAEDLGGFHTDILLATPTATNEITVPDDDGVILLDTNIGSTVQAWDIDLDQIAAVANVDGDLLVTTGGGTPVWDRLAIGSANRVLGVHATNPDHEWKDIVGTANEINVAHTANTITIGLVDPLIATKGGTGFASYAVGDLLYADTTTTLAKLADVATGNALISGGVGAAPTWDKIDLTTHVSGDLPFTSFQQIATDRLVGRDTAGTGDVEEISVGGGLEFTGSAGIQRSALTGDITAAAGSNSTTFAAGNIADLHALADADGFLKNTGGTLSWAASSALVALNDLTDVTITAAATSDILRFDGAAWVNYPDSNYVPSTRTVGAGAGLIGGGALSGNITLNVQAGFGITVGINDVGLDLAADLSWTGEQFFAGPFGWYDAFADDHHTVTTAAISDPAAFWTLTTLGDTTIDCNNGHIIWTVDGNIAFTIKDAEVSVTTGTNWSLATSGAGTKWGTGATQLQAWWNATPVVQDTGWTVSNVTTDRSFNANATSIDELADVLGTLITTLKTYGLLGG